MLIFYCNAGLLGISCLHIYVDISISVIFVRFMHMSIKKAAQTFLFVFFAQRAAKGFFLIFLEEVHIIFIVCL